LATIETEEENPGQKHNGEKQNREKVKNTPEKKKTKNIKQK
jgi:hypothetical protein